MKPSTVLLDHPLKKADHLEVVQETVPALRVKMALPLQKPANRILKRAVDLILTVMLLPPFLLLLPFIALFIRLDSPGPVFFRQRRLMRGNKPFTCWKFRTMVVNAEADATPAYEADPRITGAGTWLRRTHLDELPQLFNVLRGEMSLVGPRPYMLSDHARYEHLIPHYHLRHIVKPGLTGLAQASGHFGQLLHAKEMEERVALDHRYVRSWSAWLDLRILFQTLVQRSRRP